MSDIHILSRPFAGLVVAATAVALTGCGGGGGDGGSPMAGGPTTAGPTTAGMPSATSQPAAATSLDIKDFRFDPSPARVAVGAKITWTNRDGAPHSVVADDKSFESETLEQNQAFTFTADKAGTVSYICGIHNYMKGELVVG